MINIDDIYKADCIEALAEIDDASVDCVLTDPPYLYLQNQKLDREFDEVKFFDHVKRILKKDGFIVMFGRGTSFYRWNTMLAERGFSFKEEIVWNKGYCTSPLMPLSRVHETVSIHSKGNGSIIKQKVPYLEMKKYDIAGICQDIKRISGILKNPKSLKAVLDFLENNQVPLVDDCEANYLGVSSNIKIQDRCAAVMGMVENGCNEKSIIKEKVGVSNINQVDVDRAKSCMQSLENGLTEKSIIRTDREQCDSFTKYGVNSDNRKSGDRCCNVLQSLEYGLNEKSIIQSGRDELKTMGIQITHSGITREDRCVSVLNGIENGMNEKSILAETPDHYTAIHPTQKPTRLLERLMALVTKEGDLVVDPFSGSGSTAIAAYNTRRHFIGFEIDDEYYQASMKRLKKETQQTKLAI